ncbi:MAG: hypothetical protein EAX89_03490 [Candidatus Lokiarchaeota archaeon]|nr:hypothetical protein [Candidatus Lokiarchaeota archaeon]
MPLRFRWTSKEYLPIALMLFGVCGLFQVLFVFIAQYFLSVGNYIVIILIPIGISIALFFGNIIIFESFAQIERKKVLKNQYYKSRSNISKLKIILQFPIIRPLTITFPTFAALFFISFSISTLIINNTISFIVAENVAALVCLLIANLIEKNYAKVQRY